MFQQADVIEIGTPEELRRVLGYFLGVSEPQEENTAGPFDTHAANLESLAGAITAGMEKIATQSGIPEDLTDDMVPASLLETEQSLSTALALAAISLRMQAAGWRKAGAKI